MKRKWIIHILIPAVLCIIGILCLGTEYKKYQNAVLTESTNLREASEKLKELDSQKEDLQKKLEDLQSEYSGKNKPAYAVIPVFTTPDKDVFPKVAELLKSYQWNGIIGLTKEMIPGDEEALSTEEYDELMASGWQSALCWDGEEDLSDFLRDMKSRLTKAKMSFPDVLVIKEGFYSESYRDLLKEYEIETIICRSDPTDNSSAEDKANGSPKRVDLCDWYENELDLNLSKVQDEGGAFCTVCYNYYDDPNESLKDATGFFEYMWDLNYEDRRCYVTNLDGYARILERESDGVFVTNRDSEAYTEQIAELEKEIEAIDRQREAILGTGE